MSEQEEYHWRKHISVVDSSLSQEAINNIVEVDTEMLVHMNDLQDRVQADLTKFEPVIVAQFTPWGGKFTLLTQAYGKEASETIEPVPNLFALSKAIAHAPLGIYGCFGSYATNPLNQGWRDPLKSYCTVLETALATIDNVGAGYQIDAQLKKRLIYELNTLVGKYDEAPVDVDEKTVIPHIVCVFKTLLESSINFVNNTALQLGEDRSPAAAFQKWCNESSEDDENPNDTLYKLIVQCQVISATTQQYGISTMMKAWKKSVKPAVWKNLYVIVEAEWVTRKLNSIAQCILPFMVDGDEALDEHLLIVTNLSDVDSALHFLARILEDRAAAAMILTDHSEPRDDLSGQVDLLGPVMQDVVCPHMSHANKATKTVTKPA
jgi:hypothetical protein